MGSKLLFDMNLICKAAIKGIAIDVRKNPEADCTIKKAIVSNG